MTRQVLVDADLLERLAGYAERFADRSAWPELDEVEGIDCDVSFARLLPIATPAEPELEPVKKFAETLHVEETRKALLHVQTQPEQEDRL